MFPVMIFTVMMKFHWRRSKVCKQDAKAPKKLSLLPASLGLLWNLVIALPLKSL